MNKAFRILFLLFLSFVFIMGYWGENEMVMLTTLFSLFAYQCIYTFRNINDRITLLVFLVAFFTFLMGRILLPLFTDVNDLIVNIGGAEFYTQTYYHIYTSLFIALLFIYLGYHRAAQKDSSIPITYQYDSVGVLAIRKYTKKLSYFTFLFASIVIYEQIRFVLVNGYFAFYVDFESNLPYPVILAGALFDYCVYLFLATMPSKKECRPIIFLYLFNGISYMGIGQRGSFVLNFLFVITYLFLRNKIRPGNKPWIGRKGIISLLISMPLLVSFLYIFAYIRTDSNVIDSKNLILSFIYQQGVSVEVIGYTYEYEDYFPKGKVYSIGDIINYFNHNKIAQVFGDKEPVKPQSIEHALDDHSLDAALTYFVKPHLYLRGGGLGSSYIAEAWKDFGYLGVIIFSYIYGLILALIPQWCHKGFWWTAIGFIMYNNIIFAPRARAIKFIFEFFSLAVILILISIYLYSKYKTRKIQTSSNLSSYR